MVARQFNVHHNGSEFVLDCDTDDGLEVLKFQIFSLTSILPDDQKISIEGQNLILNESYDLESVSDKLRLVSIHEEPVEDEEEEVPIEELEKSDAELARILQAEEEALFFQQYRASQNREEFEGRVRPYVKQVRRMRIWWSRRGRGRGRRGGPTRRSQGERLGSLDL